MADQRRFADIPILGRISALVPFFRTPAPMPAPTKDELQAPMGLVDPGRLLQGWLVYPYNPSWLASRKGLAIYDVMKRDEQVKAALKFKKQTVLVPGWEIVSPKGQKQDWEVSEFVRYVLGNIEGGFQYQINKIMTAMEYGFSASEKIYEEINVGPWKGKVALSRLNAMKPHFINFIQDEFGRLLALRQYNVHMAVHDMPPEKFCIYSYSKEFENYYGISDLESAYRPWWVKDCAYKWFAVALERYGMPPLFAMYNPDSYTAEQIADLRDIVKSIQNGTFGILPRRVPADLEMWTQQIGRDSNGTFIAALKRFDDDIAKALLMPGLIGFTSDHGGSSGGSHARSAQQFKSFIQVILHLQVEIADAVINQQIIRQLCDINFPGLDVYPRFRFLPFEDEDKMDVLKTWQGLVEGRVVNRVEEDETHIRRMLDFPENPDPELQELPLPKGSGGMPGGNGGGDGGAAPPAAKDNTVDEFGERSGHAFRGNQWDRVRAAIASHKPATAETLRIATQSEARIAKMVNGTHLENNQPVDVVINEHGKKHGIEVKTFLHNSHDKVTIHPESMERKLQWAKNQKAILHTVVVDKRSSFQNGKHAGEYSGHELWYRRGVGSFKLNGLVRVRDAHHLRDLIKEAA